MPLIKRCIAEFIGRFWLVLGGCGSAVLAAAFTQGSARLGEGTAFPLGIGLVGVSLAFGLTVIGSSVWFRTHHWLIFQNGSFFWFMGWQTFSRFKSYCPTLLLKSWEPL